MLLSGIVLLVVVVITPTTVAGVKRLAASMILCVCVCVCQNDKLGTGTSRALVAPGEKVGEKVKVTGHKVQKGDRVTGGSYVA